MKKRSLCLALSFLFILCMAVTAHAATTKIDKVSLTFSYEEEPKSGNEVGSIKAKANDQSYYVDYAEYTNDVDTWSVGDRPVVRIGLYAADGYRFSYTSSKYFSLSGCGATHKKASIKDEGTYMELEVYLKRIGGKLSGAENLEWSGATAVWDELNGAKSYEVRLYRDDKSVATEKVTGTSYDFSGYLTKEGCYNFSVRAVASYNDRAGEWSDYSEDYYVDEEDLQHMTANGSWVQNQKGWWYSYGNGSYPASCWKLINGQWYYFNWEGYMVTGWQKIDGRWYYLNPSGAMTTGWQFVNNRWYFMDGSGVMQTGWQYVNGKWYCLDDSGAMYANTTTPDGRYVDSSGARAD